jgi:hypothetical protein
MALPREMGGGHGTETYVLAYISRAWEFTGKKIEQYHASLTIMKNARNEN